MPHHCVLIYIYKYPCSILAIRCRKGYFTYVLHCIEWVFIYNTRCIRRCSLPGAAAVVPQERQGPAAGWVQMQQHAWAAAILKAILNPIILEHAPSCAINWACQYFEGIRTYYRVATGIHVFVNVFSSIMTYLELPLKIHVSTQHSFVFWAYSDSA